MTPEQIAEVETSFARLGAVTEALGVAFYDRLFEIDPSVRHLFRDAMDEQAIKLMQVLAFAVSNLREPDKLLPVVRELGRKHAGYGVEDVHYVSVRLALLYTLGGALGPAWTADVEAAWVSAFETIHRK